MNFNNQKRFSVNLIMTVVILVTGSVVLISGILYIYLGKRLESEFKKKALAQKGQIEIILKNRIDRIKKDIEDLSNDNTLKVTMMLDTTSRLEELFVKDHPVKNMVHFYIKKQNQKRINTGLYPYISHKIIDFVSSKPVFGEIFVEGDKTHLLWWFEAPVMDQSNQMGTVYALYDMTQDRNLAENIRQNIDGDLYMAGDDSILSLTSNAVFQIDSNALKKKSAGPKFIYFKNNLILSKIHGFKNLYFLFSQENLIKEKRRISVLIISFSFIVLAVSVIFSIFLSKQMVRPLRGMAQKALLISKGEKNISFDNINCKYTEFNQLSRAFSFMLTSLKEAEEKSRYNELMENVDDSVYLVNRDGNIIEANKTTYTQLECPDGAFSHLNLADIVPEKDAKIFLNQLVNNESRHNDSKITLETSHLGFGGKVIPVEINSRIITYRGEKVILNVARDINERKRAERALRESEMKYRSVVENSCDGIMITDHEYEILYVNNELCNILGCSRKAIEGERFIKFLADESINVLKEHNLKKDKNKNAFNFIDLNIVRKDGEKRYCKFSATDISYSTEKVKRTVIHLLDETDQLKAEQEKKQLESQLIHAEKMQAIGTLAGGIAHDFNNLLMGISGRTSLILMNIDPDNANYEDIIAIKNAVKNAASLTKQLLGFARGGKYEIKPTCMNDILEKNSQMFGRMNKEIMIHKNFQTDIGIVDLDQGQISQVLLNLFVNAKHAMPDGGDLYIETKNVELNEKLCKPLELPPGNYVKISVKDTGIGIDKQLMDRIFEPFFTTKEMGMGTGLGLASVYGIIKNHNGTINVNSEKGKGTTFNIYLPITNRKVSKEMEIKTDRELIKGKETILLVDDEKEPIEVGKMMLEALGYKVILAKSGKEALTVYRENSEKIDMVVLDMIMPEMSGSETYKHLKKISSEVKVLLSSGYSFNRQAEEIIDNGCIGFIQKPFSINQLSYKIREVLKK